MRVVYVNSESKNVSHSPQNLNGMLHLFLVWSGGVTNIQDKPDMPHRATYFCKEDSSPAENCDELCLIHEKVLETATVLLFHTGCR